MPEENYTGVERLSPVTRTLPFRVLYKAYYE